MLKEHTNLRKDEKQSKNQPEARELERGCPDIPLVFERESQEKVATLTKMRDNPLPDVSVRGNTTQREAHPDYLMSLIEREDISAA